MASLNEETVREGQGAAPDQFLTFRIADETYALGILQVKEILRYETITKVPSTPLSIRGVINLRGSVVPVFDLAVKFGLPESRVSKLSCIVIVEAPLDGERTVMGLMADSVKEVLELRPDEIEPPPPFGTRVRVDYLLGMGKSDRKFVLILDIDRLINADEILAAALLQEGAVGEGGEANEEENTDGEEAPETTSVVAAAGAPSPGEASKKETPAPGEFGKSPDGAGGAAEGD